MSDPPLAEFAGVSKWYGPVIAVNDVTFRLPPGVTGLVGPNGAGKSTLIKLLTGQLRPSLGTVRVHGLKAWSADSKARIGYCPDADAFYEEMPGRAFVRTIARLHGFRGRSAGERAEEVLRQVGMADRADRPLGTYSKGMRQRIKLAQALVHDPGLLVLDEPLNGIDPAGRADLESLFCRLGKTIVISSHVLEDMDRLADQILFLSRGRILASGSVAQIREMLEDHPLRVRIGAARPRELAARLIGSECVRAAEMDGDAGLVVQVRPARHFFELLARLAECDGFDIRQFEVLEASAQAVFDYLNENGNR